MRPENQGQTTFFSGRCCVPRGNGGPSLFSDIGRR
jgi:hypothetical protein